MALHAIIVNVNTLDFVEQNFGGKNGVPAECLEKETFFVYSDDFRDHFRNCLVAPENFKKTYEWQDPNHTNNVVVPI